MRRREDVLRRRLSNQGLTRPRASRARDVVASLGAVQAQDWPAARWSLALRMVHPADADIVRDFDAGEILRTHVLRPTWHFVTPDDLRWMLELTAPRVRKVTGHSNRKLGLDPKLLARTTDVIARALEGRNHLTRRELGVRLAAVGVETDTQRLAHVVMEAELDGLVCSGPLRGKQHTYALVEERVAAARPRAREEALAELCLRYFTGHGPAQLRDFAWWSGLGAKEAGRALALCVDRLESRDLSGRTFHFVPGGRAASLPAALLLSIYDEYTIAYGDRSDLSDERDVARMLSMGNALTAVIVLDGRVAGSWRRALSRRRLTVTLGPFRRLTGAQRAALAEQVDRMRAFFGVEEAVVE